EMTVLAGTVWHRQCLCHTNQISAISQMDRSPDAKCRVPTVSSGQIFPILLASSRAITAYRCILRTQRKKPMKIPTQAEIENKLRGEDLNEWLDLWRTEQGPAKP